MLEQNKYKVYIKIDENKCITNVESSLTLSDTSGYIQIDEGVGDKYSHAQGNYFSSERGEKPLRDEKGRCNYKYVDNNLTELTDEEKDSIFTTSDIQPTDQQVLNSKLLEENANIKLELEQQKSLNSEILLQLATLGGNLNV